MNDIKALNGKLDRLLLIKQKEVHNGGYNKGFNNYMVTPNLSYRSQNVAYPQHHVYPPQQQYNPYMQYPPYNQNEEFIHHPQYQGGYQQPQPQYTPHYGFAPTPQFHGGYHQQQPPAPGFDLQATLQQILQGQANCDKKEAQGYSDIMTHLDSSYNDLYSRLEDLNSRVHHLERNIASTSSSNPLPQPRGNSFQQPNEFAKAITLRSGRQLPPRDSPVVVTEGSEDQEGEGICQDPAENVLLGQRNSAIQPELAPLGQGNSAIQPELPPLDHHYPSEPVRVASPSAEQVDKAKMKDKTFVPPPYKPPLPFPGRFKEEIKELCQAQVDKFIERITTVMPLKKAFNLLPPGNDYLKSLVLKRIEEADSLAKEEEEATAVIKEKPSPMKLEKPGSFTLPFSLGSSTFRNSLCDLGSSVSLVPLSVAKKLELCEYKPCNLSLMLADGTVRLPHGLLEDVPVKVGNTIVPTDFVALKMDKEPKDPLIFGRLFLATVGAVIGVRKGIIEVKFDRGKGFKMKLDIKDAVKKQTIEGHTFLVEKIEQLAKEGQSQSALNRNKFFENWIKKGKERTLEPLYEPP